MIDVVLTHSFLYCLVVVGPFHTEKYIPWPHCTTCNSVDERGPFKGNRALVHVLTIKCLRNPTLVCFA